MEIRKDIFTDKYLWLDAGEDFNTKYNIQPGNAVLIPKSFDWIHLKGKINGITFLTDGQTEGGQIKLGDSAGGAVVVGCKIVGNLSVPYGIRLTDKSNFGMNLDYCGDLEISGVEVAGSYMGMHMGTNPTLKYPLAYQNIKVNGCFFHDTQLEAFYIGQDQLGGPFITGDIRNNKVLRAGNDGIQCRNGFFTIEDNDIDGTGVISAPQTFDHAHGILIGGDTKNSVIRRNKLRNIAGYGVFNNGFGDHIISENDIECGISGVFTKNKEFAKEDMQKVGYQKYTITGNKITAKNGLMIEMHYDNNGCPVSVTHSENTGTGKVVTDPGIVVNSPIPPTPTKEVYEKFYRIVNRKRKYYTLYKPSDGNGTYELKK